MEFVAALSPFCSLGVVIGAAAALFLVSFWYRLSFGSCMASLMTVVDCGNGRI
ncbi:uncharacterized protein DS421_15g514700 [Arachis hypogaea]|nr:uncharacterized protein DS421_15g514700 [Arachis hypogaea]